MAKEFDLQLSVMMQVIEDFFICNPIASILERLNGMLEKVTTTITTPPTALMN
ncbi:MAG: hypothetical protein WCJ49_07590 [Deltaproteobacteria bacterium]